MRALLDDLALLHDRDDVSIAYGRQPVSNDHSRAAHHEVVKGRLDDVLTLRVEGAGRFIWIGESKGNQLLCSIIVCKEPFNILLFHSIMYFFLCLCLCFMSSLHGEAPSGLQETPGRLVHSPSRGRWLPRLNRQK